MTKHEDNIMEELIAESKEHLESIEPDLMALEEHPNSPDPEAINRIFRAVHSIKGGFGFFSMNHIKDLSHAMENVIGRLRDGEIVASADTVDVLLEGADKIRVMIDDVEASECISIEDELAKLNSILNPISSAKGGAKMEPDTVTSPSESNSIFEEAMEILRSKESGRLAELESRRFEEILKQLYENAPVGRQDDIEDILNDYEACENAMGLDPIIREGLAEKLQPLASLFLEESSGNAAEEAASTAKEPDEEAQSTSHPPLSQSSGIGPQSLRVKVDLLDKLMNLAGELVLSRNRIKRTLSDRLATEMATSIPLTRLQKQLENSRERMQLLADGEKGAMAQSCQIIIEREFDAIKQALSDLLESSFSELPSLGGAVQDIDAVTSELQSGIMGTRMQPVGSVFSKFPRVIRDMNRKMGKDIELSIQGQNVELDKSIIEALGDPLTHLIRNSADHGIECPEKRKTRGKPVQGTIHLIARHEGGQVFIEIIDDGAGIDPDRVKAKALEKNLITPREAETMTDREALRLIFAPGFSTAETVSDVSGRGVGMDVVRSNIEGIGGTVDIDSVLGEGCRISLKLPLTLAIMPALVIENEDRIFAIPQVDIEELVRVRARDVHNRIENLQGKPVIRLREKILPLVSLNEILGIEKTFINAEGERVPDRRQRIIDKRSPELPLAASEAEGQEVLDSAVLDEEERRETQAGRRRNRRSAFNIIVLRIGPNRYGLIVESLRDSEEIVVKPLPGYLKDCPSYAGATIMGDGSVAMILDASGMAEKAQLHFGGDLENAEAAQSDIFRRQSMREKQSLLLFQNGAKERFAVNMSMIKRIEKIDCSEIEQVHDKQYLKYEDSSLRLISLHEYMPVSPPERECSDCYVLVPRMVRHPMGILVTDVNDVLETEAALDHDTITGTGILGSFVEKGSLYICLDIYSLFEAAEPDIYGNACNATLEGKRVLLAEDTSFFRTVETTYLTQIGCEVDTAPDGEEAWNKLTNQAYDLLITDIQMPVLDGLGLARRVRDSQEYKKMPIVALTSLTNEADRERILKAGVDAYEAKLDKESLRTTIENLVSKA